MIRSTALLLLALTPALAQITKTAATNSGGHPIASFKGLKIAPGTFTTIEKRFDQQFANLFDANDPLDLLGFTRGVYLDGYGVVFTTEVSLMVTPRPSPFMQTISKEMADKVRRRKVERLPFLKAIMKEMIRAYIEVGDITGATTQLNEFEAIGIPQEIEPMMALQSEVTRTDRQGNVWGPQQRITVEEAIRVGTLNGAYASYEENLKGSIEAGKLADLVVLGRDPLKENPSTLVTIPVERTMAGGRWTFES